MQNHLSWCLASGHSYHLGQPLYAKCIYNSSQNSPGFCDTYNCLADNLLLLSQNCSALSFLGVSFRYFLSNFYNLVRNLQSKKQYMNTLGIDAKICKKIWSVLQYVDFLTCEMWIHLARQMHQKDVEYHSHKDATQDSPIYSRFPEVLKIFISW